ncbi:protein DDI1 homolog 2 [Galendromus occidentalis]|uniref:Protein DDI1 homolog 2 n=1 Tax=Galendromus occidentalis TaxID=34638 RepID=A0AAJ6VZ31_9ACAR|nr:protein DDI1 homolog 2 [Galendromus occidentalis]
MRITITTVTGDVFVLDVSADIELENLKALAAFEVGIPAAEMIVIHEMRPLTEDKRPISQLGLKDGDMVLVQKSPPRAQRTPQGSLPENDPAVLRQMLLSDPEQLALVRQKNPQLAEALERSPEEFDKYVREFNRERAEREMARIRMLTADPFNPEAQALIAEEIRQKNIDSNMEAAMEHHPEAFGTVVMLYINCKVNGHPVKAFVDSGAQRTIMSSACAERCGIMRLVDPRWAGIAKGVGTQKILGRIHLVQIEIEKDFLTTSFSVLEAQPMDMLLGLDLLRRFECVLDLKQNELIIGTTGTRTQFLPESELPAHARLDAVMDEESAMKAALENSKMDTSAGPSTSQGSSSGSVLSSLRYGTETQVKEIMALGFKREDAVRELEGAKGDKNVAIGALFAKSFTVPK